MRLANECAEAALKAAAGGDQAAFAELVRQHQGMVYGLAWHFLHNRELAEEMSQEVFLHLYRCLDAIESPAHLVQWLRKVASHRCIDQSRRLKHRPRVGLDAAPEPSAPARPGDPMLAKLLDDLVATLPEKPRLAVILRYQEDLDPMEIARILDIPLGTVKSTLHRALAVLRGRFERAQSISKGVFH